MTAPDLVLFNTAEEVLSSDLTTIGGLAGKAVQDALAMTEQGLYSTLNPRTCVRDGLDATPGTGLAVQLTAGSCMIFDAAAPAADASRYKLGRLAASESLAIAPNAGPNPRLDLIYGTVVSIDDASSSRLELNLPGRTISPVTVSKRRSPDLTLAVATGTPAASPAAPATPAGTVPLWYVYVPAGITSIDTSYLIDARVPFFPWDVSRSHARIDGLYVSGRLGTNQVWISSGRGIANGVQFSFPQDYGYSGVDISPDGATALVASTEYFVYLVPRGASPVGKSVRDNFVPVLSTVVPGLDSRPSAAIIYRPLFNSSSPSSTPNVQFTTTNALYIGSARTLISTTFTDDSIPLNPTGLFSNGLISLGSIGMATSPNGFIVRPYLGWLNANTVSVGECVALLRGVPVRMTANAVTMPGDLVAGNVETPSTFYYVYVRNRTAQPTFPRTVYRELVQRISSEPPNSKGTKPTPETGFASDDYLYVGSFYNDSGSNIRQFSNVGHEHQWIGTTEILNLLGIVAVAPAFTDITTIAPNTATGALVRLNSRLTGAANQTAFIYAYPGLTGGSALATLEPWSEATIAPEVSMNLRIAISSATKKFQLNRTAPGAGTPVCGVFQYGYVEDPSVPYNTLA